MIATIYEYSDTINGNVNFENLTIALQSSPLAGVISVEGINGKIYVHTNDEVPEEDKPIMDDLIARHDGFPARTTASLQKKREGVFSTLVNLSHAHPTMGLNTNMITEYLTSIDNWINAWKRDGNHEVLVSKIIFDSSLNPDESLTLEERKGPYYDFLNQFINLDGVKAFQFLIGGIPQTPFI